MPDIASITGRRIMVTGGHGFIGRHVTAELVALGARPIAVAHPRGRVVDDLPAELLRLDLEDPDAVQGALAGFDTVVHLAASAGGIQFQESGAGDIYRTNRTITDNLLRSGVAHGVERIFLASSLVTYRPADDALEESHPQLGPRDRPSPYAWSKITDEVVAGWHQSMQPVFGRFGNVFGPGASFDPDRSTVIHALIDRAASLRDGEAFTVWGDGSAVRSFVYVEDAARAVVTVLSSGEAGEAYNIDSGESVTIGELARIVRDEVNPALRLEFDATKPAGAPFRVSSIGKLTGLGYEPRTSLREGVAKTVEWYRKNRDSPSPQ